jgi:hypothetical protein
MPRHVPLDYKTRVQRHLARYKTQTLGITQHGTWGRHDAEYPHILPAEMYRDNIVAGARDVVWQLQARGNWALQPLFHHLSSSQALAFNLFAPLIAKWPGAADALLPALGIIGRTLLHADVEVVLDKTEGTEFDAMLELSDGSRALVEVKFTESVFGSARIDDAHREKLIEVYLPMLSGRVDAACLTPARFFRDYQLYRSLAWVRPDSGDELLIVIPQGNASLWKYACEWTANPELGTLAGKARVVALEDVLATLESQRAVLLPQLATHVSELVAKYQVA